MINKIDALFSSVQVKLDRLLNDVEFIKGRVSSYLGNREAITYLPDDSPIFINTDDMGCPVNFLNGGRYEEDYLSVFLSFRSPGMTMLDIGANLGVYSLRLAPYNRNGNIHSFEPIKKIRDLFSRSVFLNGFGNIVNIHPFAVSDVEGRAIISVPENHAGGASVQDIGGASGAEIDIKPLDVFFGNEFTCDLVKLDVEGHELSALKGMRGILDRSKRAVVMFEKLGSNSGIESELFDFFGGLGFIIYRLDGVSLAQVNLEEFANGGAYYFATRESVVAENGFRRNFVNIFPEDMNVVTGEVVASKLMVSNSPNKGDVIFYGPYWYLPRGYYKFSFDGDFNGEFTVEVCERFGFKIFSTTIGSGNKQFEFPVHRDLTKFEVVLRSHGKGGLQLRKIKVERIG